MNSSLADWAVVPEFILRLDWPNVGRSSDKTLISRTSIRTRATSSEDFPRGLDMLVLLFLCDLATRSGVVRFNARDMAVRYDLCWSRREVLNRLHRILACVIELPTQHYWRRLRIATSHTLDWNSGEVCIEFGREFRYAAESAPVYSIAVAQRLARKIGALLLYLMLVTIIYRSDYRKYWEPYQELRAAARNSKIAQLLRERLALITIVWPANPFRWVHRTTTITCTKRAFSEHVFRRDEAEEERRMDQEIDTRNREEFRAYLATLPFWIRERLMKRYIERSLFRLDEELATYPSPATNTPSDTPGSWTPAAPDPLPPTSNAPTPRDDQADDESIEPRPIAQDERVGEVVPPPDGKLRTTPRHTPKRNVSNAANAERPAGLIGRTRARINHVRTRAKQLAERIRNMGRGKDKAGRAPPSA